MTMNDVYFGLLAVAVAGAMAFLPRWGKPKARTDLYDPHNQDERGYAAGILHCETHGVQVSEDWLEQCGIGDEYDRAYARAIRDFKEREGNHV